MGKGKRWSQEECKHLAEAWVAASEDVGSAQVKGTNQDSDEFWNKVKDNFAAYAPSNVQGTYHGRELSAIKNQWKDKISRDVKKFNKALVKVLSSNPTGCTEENKIAMAVAIHLGKTSIMSYRHKDFEVRDWPFYHAWLALKDHRAFQPPAPAAVENVVELENEEEEEEADFDSGNNSPSGENGGSGTKNLFQTPAPQKAKSRGPGPRAKKTKAKAEDEEYRSKKVKVQQDLLEVQRTKQKELAGYFKNQARAQAFKMATIHRKAAE